MSEPGQPAAAGSRSPAAGPRGGSAGHAPQPGYQRLESIGEYRAAFDSLLAQARREILLFDVALGPDFDRPQRIDLLRTFLAADRDNRLRIVLHDAQPVSRDCPRLCRLLRQYSEAISIRQTLPAARSAADPLLVVDATHALRQVHFRQSRSVLITDDPVATRPLHERMRQLDEASAPAVSPTVLGL